MLTINNTLDGYLKDVEIKGNTVQDASNLADIRSVGEKVEGQELYEIPVLSCGKNLINIPKHFEKDMKWKAGNVSYLIDYVKLKPNTDYTFTGKYAKSISETGHGGIGLYLLNSIPQAEDIWYVTQTPKQTLYQYETPNQTINKSFNSGEYKYFAIYLGVATSTTYNHVATLDDAQLEEGAVVTPYEPYIEDKLTILSPVQLEKVGDVADRIIEKDGVWGVEKNVITCRFNGSENFNPYSNQGQINTKAWRVDISGHVSSWQTGYGICNEYTFAIGNDVYSGDFPCVTTDMNSFIIRDYVSKYNTVTELKNGLALNNLVVKLPAITSQFIPLPHDQQVKLRTFANKTNISFLTEIEGTIKAQVPKSLGATVNTHTEQISNLNKELDRVKKLEESTVSTVETESDFTTVEATSNGYFEDVKLEGKTLVNLDITGPYKASGGYTTVTEDKITITNPEVYTFVRYVLKNRTFKLGKEYTFVINVNTTDIDNTRFFLESSNGSSLNSIDTKLQNGINVIKITPTKEDTPNFRLAYIKANTNISISFDRKILILEGDHTQNPPSYFEGLKSVGQETDEIVVSSVNENLISIEDIATPTNYISSSANYYIQPLFIGKGNTCYMNVELNGISTDSNVVFLLSNQRVNPHYSYKKIVYPNNTTLVISDSIKADDNGYVYLACHLLTNLEKATSFINKISLSCKDNKYTPHQADKKRLLFYNNETQTWEKPVFREWDSIEKHSDGKYYYHQRSAEVVLNGSESWLKAGEGDNENGVSAYVSITSIKPNGRCISDILKGISFSNHPNNTDFVCSHASLNNIIVNVSNSKLSTQDVAGFKQWLQANNVTVVYQLAEEKVYECTNIDLITYANETNYIVESGAIVPRSTLKVHNNISNVVSLLQKKVSLLESNITSYMITQNRMQLASTYSADSVTFKVDYALCSEEVEYNEDLYNLILNNILVGKDNYNYDKMFNMVLDYASWNQISWEQFDILVGLMDIQHNPPVEDEVIEEIPNEIM